MPQGHPAARQNGVCRGSLWKQHISAVTPGSHPKDEALLRNEREKRHEYCILIGHTLSSYPDLQSYRRGHDRTSETRIVGASAWNPTSNAVSGSKLITPSQLCGGGGGGFARSPPRKVANGTGSGKDSSPSRPVAGSSAAAGAPHTSTAAMHDHYSSNPTFRIVTYAGTQVYCVAPTCTDRDVWLSALHSGLEASYATTDAGMANSPVKDVMDSPNGKDVDDESWTCKKCGGKCHGGSASTDLASSPSFEGRGAKTNDDENDSVVSDTSSNGSSSSSSSILSTSSSSDGGDSDPWTPPQHERRRTRNRVNSIKYPVKQIHLSPKKRQTSMDYIELMKPPGPTPLQKHNTTKYCRSCGLYKSHPPATEASFKLYYQACPLPQYNYETRASVEYVCQGCYIAQGLLCDIRELNGLYCSFAHERAAMRAARGAAREAVRQAVEKRTTSEEGQGRASTTTATEKETMQSGESTKNALNNGTGGSSSASSISTSGSPCLEGSWETIPDAKQQRNRSDRTVTTPGKSSTMSTSSSGNSWHQISPADAGTSALLQLLQTPGFATLRRRSRALELECLKLESGLCSGAVEFLDIIDSLCGGPKDEYGNSSKMEMKKEAFKVAGDMSAAMKLLHDHALGVNVREAPSSPTSGTMDQSSLLDVSFTSSYTTHGNSIYMLRCILELLLDLCEEGELSAVAFFWPQLRHLHLRMLPPSDADDLIRVELLEDFLLTVSARFSVHLALELLWGCVADLEEAFQGMNLWPSSNEAEKGESSIGMLGSGDDVSGVGVNDKCRMRRFAVLRFLCELESIMFGFEGGWGGGSVALRGILSPSEHQDHLASSGATATNTPLRTMVPSKEVLLRNAHYFASQLLFIRRLGDIAECLRHLPVYERQATLQSQLERLNLKLKSDRECGRVAGGDPLSRGASCNVVGGDGGEQEEEWGLAPVVNIPSKEGHVFRSKERTPVLLLLEVIRECGAASDREDARVEAGKKSASESADGSDAALPELIENASDEPAGTVASVEEPDGSTTTEKQESTDVSAQDAVSQVANSTGTDATTTAGYTDLNITSRTGQDSSSNPEKDDVLCGDGAVEREPEPVGTDDSHPAAGSLSMDVTLEKDMKGMTLLEHVSETTESVKKQMPLPGNADTGTTSEPPLFRAESPAAAEDSSTVAGIVTTSSNKQDDSVATPRNLPPAPPSTPITASPHHKSNILKRLDGQAILSRSTPSPSGSSKKISATLSTATILGDEMKMPELPLPGVDSSDGEQSRQRVRSVDKETEELVVSVMEEKLSIHERSSSLHMPKLEELGLAVADMEPLDDETGNAAATPADGGPGPVSPGEVNKPVVTPGSKKQSLKRPDDFSKCGSGAVIPSPPGGIRSKTSSGGATGGDFLQKKYQQVQKAVVSSVVGPSSRKMSALGSSSSVNRSGSTAINMPCQAKSTRYLSTLASTPYGAQHPPLAAYGEGRREVLATILAKGMKGGNVVAKSAAGAAQRGLQALDRHRAVELIRNSTHGDEARGAGRTARGSDAAARSSDAEDAGGGVAAGEAGVKGMRRSSAASSVHSDDGVGSSRKGDFEVNFPQRQDSVRSMNNAPTTSGSSPPSTSGTAPSSTTSAPSGPRCTAEEEEEAMESLRLVLIQNRVAQGNLSPEHAARALGPDGKRTLQEEVISFHHQDAGEIDPRLSGCGPLSHGLLSAIKLWQTGVISNAELLELAHKDQLFIRSALPGADNLDKLMDDSAFWVRFSFGERWAEKKARISARSVHGNEPGHDLVSVIVKSNDDLRQEAFVMQLIDLCQEAFEVAGLELWLHPYRIVATGRTTGIIETVKNALSFDSLKKRPGYQNMGGLRGHFIRMTEFAAKPKEAFRAAQHNFVRSLAAYSLISFLFEFKDRHNGNLLLDTAGHVIHIDFGFVFGIAPGGAFSLESGTPFKFTEEMIEVMGGVGSPLFSEFVTLFCCGFLALQAHVDTFLTLVEITCEDSTFPCFAGKDSTEVVEKVRERFCPHLNKSATISYALELIKLSLTSYGTRQYDFFQYLSQGIAT